MYNENLLRTSNVKKKKFFRLYHALQESMILLTAVVLFVVFSTGFDLNKLKAKIDVEQFFEMNEYKNILNSSFKIIDSTYDSGTQNNLETYVSKFVKDVTNIDYKNPIDILNIRIPAFSVNLQEYAGGEEIDSVENIEKNNEVNSKESDEKKKKNNNKEKKNKKNTDIKRINKNEYYIKGNIKMTNLAGVSVNINKLVTEDLYFATDKSKKEILIYHTHTSEDYKDYGDYGVLQAGRFLKSFLDEIDVNAIHNATKNDVDFNSSYTKSFNTVSSVMKGNKDIDVIIDLHRDAVGNGRLCLANEYNGKKYAQLMFVVGTDKTLANPMWKENLKLAAKLYDEMNSICPGIMRPLYITTRRYNQHLSNGSLLIEVGGDGNNIEECKNSMKVFAKALEKVLYC